MRKLLVTALLGATTFGVQAAALATSSPPPHIWSGSFAGSFQGVPGDAVAVDSAGNSIITGFFQGLIDFGSGSLSSAGDNDIFLAKFNSNGAPVFSFNFGDTSADIGNSVTVDSSGNVVITGKFKDDVNFGGGTLTSAGSDDIYVAKLGPSGNHLWSKRFGDADCQDGQDVAVDTSGNVILTGVQTTGTVDFGGGPLTNSGSFEPFVAKFDSNGNHLWSKLFTGATALTPRVTVDPSGNVTIAGSFSGSVDFGGGLLAAGVGVDTFVASFDPTGSHRWSGRFGSAGAVSASGVAVDISGNVVIVGNLIGSVDFGGDVLTSTASNDVYVAQFDASGNHLWSKLFGDTDDPTGDKLQQFVTGVAVDTSRNVVITGGFGGVIDFGGGPLTSTGSNDVYLAEFDSDGNHRWSQRFGDLNAQQSASVAVGPGNLSIIGTFIGNVDFGGGPLTTANQQFSEIFVAAFEKPIVPVSIKPGDANQDGVIDLSDPVALLNRVFNGVPLPSATLGSEACFFAAGDFTAAGLRVLDWNCDGAIDLSDPVAQLAWQFQGSFAHSQPPGGCAVTGCVDQPCSNCILVLGRGCLDSCI